jgi:hypothetical protein
MPHVPRDEAPPLVLLPRETLALGLRSAQVLPAVAVSRSLALGAGGAVMMSGVSATVQQGACGV